MGETKPSCLPLVRKHLDNIGMSDTARDIIMASWRKTTSKQYHTYLTRWEQYCSENSIDPLRATIQHGIEFLTHLYQKGLGYSAINTARSALSIVIDVPSGTFGSQSLVTRFMKGIFEMKPSLPRYKFMWDAGIVLKHIQSMSPNSGLSLKSLTLKLTMLLCLLTGQRCQTITKLDTQYMQSLPNKYVFTINEILKTSKPGRHIAPIELMSYEPDERLCVVSLIRLYLQKTQDIRKEHTKLMISYTKPHHSVCSSTIGKWAKSIMKEAGIDTAQFSAHSGRSAAVSYGKSAGLPLQDILRAGGWSNAQTFARFYDKPLPNNFGSSILEHYSNHNGTT